ncbi:MAG: T9SS type A sorting domain-containing protein [Prolixibacteraceae bacterium]|nr:T9SS type A sorting domain-containing protein [Prolixibacteraceae bacterium]
MKNRISIFYMLSLLLSAQLLNAQIVLNNNDLPKTGDAQISVMVDSIQSINILPGGKGENIFWDFSYLSGEESDAQKWVSATATTNYSKFPLAVLAINKACTKVHSHVTHTDIETCKNDFYIKNENGLFYYGSDVQEISKYSIPRPIFPILKYGDSIKNESRLIYYSSGYTQKVLHVTGYSKADAWGTIKTPKGTVNTIRIFTSETVYDSIYTDGSAILKSKTEGNYYYNWYTRELGFPVLQISKGILSQNSNYQTVEYASKLTSVITGIEEVPENQKFVTVYPNPFNDKATLKIHPDFNGEKYTLLIFDIYGRIILKKEDNIESEVVIERRNMKTGTYFYQLLNKEININGKFAVQ